MTVDFRAIVSTNLGTCISGDIGSNHISDGSGLVMTSGRLRMNGIVTPARGTPVHIVIARPQLNLVTRFPKPLFVIRAVANPIERTSEVEVGCRLTLMKNKKEKFIYTSELYTPPEFADIIPRRNQRKKELEDALSSLMSLYSKTIQDQKNENIRLEASTSGGGQVSYFYAGPSDSEVSSKYKEIAEKSLAYEKLNVGVPILAQKVMEFCLNEIGLKLSPTSRPLLFRFMRGGIDLSSGYVEMIGNLVKSESCFGRILPNGKFEVVKINLKEGGRGPVLTEENLESIDPISSGAEPADNYIMCYTAVESPLLSEGGFRLKGYVSSFDELPQDASNGDAYVQSIAGGAYIIWGRFAGAWVSTALGQGSGASWDSESTFTAGVGRDK